MKETKTCQYTPCSRTIYRDPADKQWWNRRYCNNTCQRHANALQHKMNRKTEKHNAGFKPRSAPQISNPRFWDGILTRGLV